MSYKDNKFTREDKWFFIGLAIISAVACVYYFDHVMSQYNTSLYAISYKYGFVSRGVVGTIWQYLDAILPFNLMTYGAIYKANIIITALFYGLIYIFLMFCVKNTKGQNRTNVKYLIVFFMIFTIPMFVTRQNMGRIDIYLIAISLICVWLLIRRRAEWLIIPLCALAMLIHQGFVFTNVNIILVLILVRWLTSDKKKKYAFLFALTFIVVSVLFLYFEFNRETLPVASYEEMVQNAKALSHNNEYYEMLFKHEFLGIDVYEDESFWHLQNRIELPIFIILFIPYIVLAVRFFVSVFRSSKTTRDKWLASFVLLGSLTLLPEWILKVDYGRYVYSMVFYYIIIIIALICMKNEIIADSVESLKIYLYNISPMTILLIVYPLLFMPLYDTEISRLTYNILRLIGFRE